jgi:hypothetical protein
MGNQQIAAMRPKARPAVFPIGRPPLGQSRLEAILDGKRRRFL